MTYHWQYLKDTTARGQALRQLLNMTLYLPGIKSVLDFNCGYAPLYEHFKHTSYTGFDINKECIDHLIDSYPDGNWLLADDKDYKHQKESKIDMLLFLGMTSSEESRGESVTEAESFLRLVKETDPGIIVLESSKRIKDTNWAKIRKGLQTKYGQLGSVRSYTLPFPVNGDRRVLVLAKYPI